MLWYRVIFSDEPKPEVQSSYLGDNGPGSIQIAEKIVRYTRTPIPETAFLAVHEGYDIESRGADWFSFVR